MKKSSLLLFWFFVGIGTACGVPSTPVNLPIDAPLALTETPFFPLDATVVEPGSLPALTEVLPPQPGEETRIVHFPTVTVQTYPDTPEGVVQSFLLASQTDPARLPVYLSAGLRDQLSGGDPMTLLQFEAQVEGYAVQAGSVALGDSPSALVDVGLQISGNITRRVFSLGKEESRWVIEGVEVK